jgi:hypothetical protein
MKIDLEKHLQHRRWMSSALVREIFGPGGRYATWPDNLYAEAVPINITQGHVFETWDDYNKRYTEEGSGNEIIKDEAPSRRYGVGILFPEEEAAEIKEAEEIPADSDAAAEGSAGMVEKAGNDRGDLSAAERKQAKRLAKTQERLDSLKEEQEDVLPGEDSELDGLKLARLRRPRSMGITFVADCVSGMNLIVSVEGGRYRSVDGIKIKQKDGKVSNRDYRWWVRRPVSAEVPISVAELNGTRSIAPILIPLSVEGLPELRMQLEVRSRLLPEGIESSLPKTARLITATLVNRSKVVSKCTVDQLSFFQSRFIIRHHGPEGKVLLPLPNTRGGADDDQLTVDLLYRNCHAFAIGHGCAGDWMAEEGQARASCVIAEAVPSHETPPVTPNLVHPETKQPFILPMLPLALGEGDWLVPLKELVRLYGDWIAKQRADASEFWGKHKITADRHLRAADECLVRMAGGLRLLEENPDAALAFQMANEAVLLQQIAGSAGLRKIRYDPKAKKVAWSSPCQMPSLTQAIARNRAWRPFQIAFLLMSLKGLWDGNSEDRMIVDLIWFPTGGGKTEAYLGATAFLLFSRRLHLRDDSGTGVFMRYTLRLLTSQQFQRAAGLICAMEIIRLGKAELLGESKFRIGIWVGGDTTPNSHAESAKAFIEAKRDGPEKYSHVMLRCPWCGSQMGPRKRFWTPTGGSEQGDSRYVLEGLDLLGAGVNRKVKIFCPDKSCDFYDGLPVNVVDQEIYAKAPSLIIGTVDKFAMLAWKPEAREIFGIDADGKRKVSPPSLIIQDELHLITGPLGSMVGLYEGLIEELCTDRREGRQVRPKLIASTATTRASTRQISDLYARAKTAVFPPPGLDAGDAFFATYDRDKEEKIKPGRMYVGILARAYGSGLTVNVRVFSALLAAALRIPESERDPWWTLLVFYNSLRELGSGLTLFGADIPERLRDLQKRWHPAEKRRFLNEVLELTGRLSNSDVPRALQALERKMGEFGVIDACLASNIIEVGVDVQRLALMAVSGQPKNTAQYIQATGRVGRDLPGLVVMAYDNRKPRDLSHFEHFKDYHGRLYAAVEPASVTPFTIQVMERALHGVFIAWSRQNLSMTDQDNPREFADDNSPLFKSFLTFAKSYLERLRFLLRDDPSALAQAEKVFGETLKRRRRDWRSSMPIVWSNQDLTGGSGDMPLMRRYGEPCKTEWEDNVWPTPTSMRGVDAECSAEVCNADIDPGAAAVNGSDEDPLDSLLS